VTEKKQDFFEHLGELRVRLIKVVVYLLVGAIAGWFGWPWISEVALGPIREILAQSGSRIVTTNAPDAFLVRCQVALVAALILALPLILFEVWRFVAPALTKSEKRILNLCTPLIFILFWGGAYTAHLLIPTAVRWFSGYNKQMGVELLQSLLQFVAFYVKMLLAFGIAFQLPVVLLVLARVGLISSSLLVSKWRYAVVILAAIAAIVTPSNDAPTMLLMSIPLIGLYAFSILLVKLAERWSRETEAEQSL
jgi:sec-independent protein translocase protein TatC